MTVDCFSKLFQEDGRFNTWAVKGYFPTLAQSWLNSV